MSSVQYILKPAAPAAGAYPWLIRPNTLPSRRQRLEAFLRSYWRQAIVLLLLAAPVTYLVIESWLAAPQVAQAPKPVAPKRKPPHIDSPFAPTALRPLTAEQAAAANAAVPTSATPNPAAAAFIAPLTNATDYQRSLQCLTMAIYYEAANEPDAGQRAVAQVVLNRVRHPAYPATVCGVVFEGAKRKTGCQFTFACDGSLTRLPSPAGWRRAELVATAALGGYVFSPVGLATHYHANYVVPYWAASLDKVATFGAHIFYRWQGRWGRGAAFNERYAGTEPALPFMMQGAPELTGEASASGPPIDVAQRDRPVIIATPGAASDVKKEGRERAVSMEERWIVPRGPVEEVKRP